MHQDPHSGEHTAGNVVLILVDGDVACAASTTAPHHMERGNCIVQTDHVAAANSFHGSMAEQINLITKTNEFHHNISCSR